MTDTERARGVTTPDPVMEALEAFASSRDASSGGTATPDALHHRALSAYRDQQALVAPDDVLAAFVGLHAYLLTLDESAEVLVFEDGGTATVADLRESLSLIERHVSRHRDDVREAKAEAPRALDEAELRLTEAAEDADDDQHPERGRVMREAARIVLDYRERRAAAIREGGGA